jgi:REP element-mobilizing transposase RayT
MEEIMREVCGDFEADLARHYWRANKLWSASYFAGSVGGAPLSVLRQYIRPSPPA